jgi:hypothetical protein
MAELKTKPTRVSVDKFISAIKGDQEREDCRIIVDMMRAATKAEPQMWGPAIVGFGSSRLKYADGREMDWMQIAFSPRKQAITLYLWPGFKDEDVLVSKLGKHKRSKACLHIKRLSDVHLPTLKKIVKASAMHARDHSRK